MKYKIIALLCISLSLQANTSETLVKLLDEVYIAQAYWKGAEHNSAWRFWKRPPHKWVSKTWNLEVEAHKNTLETIESELIDHLARLSEPSTTLTPETVKHLKKKYQLELALHGVPSHFNRQWITYAGGISCVAAIALYLHRFSQNHTLFILQTTPDQDFANILDSGHRFQGHDFVNYKGQKYLQVKKNQEAMAKEFLQSRQISYNQTHPDFSLTWYNAKGESKVREFLYEHGVVPIKEILRILKNESGAQLPIFTTDPALGKELLEKKLEHLISNAAKEKETAELVEKYLRKRPVETLSYEEKRNIHDALFCNLTEIISEHVKSCANTLNSAQQRLQKTTIPTHLKQLETELLNIEIPKPLATHTPLTKPENLPLIPIPAPTTPTPSASSPSNATSQPTVVPQSLEEQLIQQGQALAGKGSAIATMVKTIPNTFTSAANGLQDAINQSQPIIGEQVATVIKGSNTLQNEPMVNQKPPTSTWIARTFISNPDETLADLSKIITKIDQVADTVQNNVIPPVIGTVQEIGTLASNLNKTVNYVNGTTLPEIHKGIKTVNDNAPAIIDNVNKTFVLAHDLAAQAKQTGERVNRLLDKVEFDFIPPLQNIVDDSQTITHTMNALVTYGQDMFKNNSSLFSLCVEILTARFTQRDLQFAAVMHELGKTTQRLKLNMEISATIPLMIAGFATHKGCTYLYEHTLVKPFLKTFKRDLVYLQLLCNKERYIKDASNLSTRYKGLLNYWITRLKRHTKKVPSALRNPYKEYLETLESKDILPEQKITVIECMFREYDFLR